MTDEVIVLVPTYKSNLSQHEEISLLQSRKILGKHPLIIIAPDGVTINNIAAKGLEYTYFSNEYFANIAGYNRLLLSSEFYERFKNFRFALICQLDTFVFKDELVKWCNQAYDYIGAPWRFDLNQFITTKSLLPFVHRHRYFYFLRKMIGSRYLVGNGGFSLRNIITARQVLNQYPELLMRFESEVKQKLGAFNEFSLANEDLFWALFVPKYVPEYRVPSYRTALQFAFEVEPAACYLDNESQLPFGCHAWEKHGIDFWRPFINNFGYHI